MSSPISNGARPVRPSLEDKATRASDLSAYSQALREAQIAFYGYDREQYLDSRGDAYRARVAQWHPPFEQRVVNAGLRSVQVKKCNASTQTDPVPEPTLSAQIGSMWRAVCAYFAQ